MELAYIFGGAFALGIIAFITATIYKKLNKPKQEEFFELQDANLWKKSEEELLKESYDAVKPLDAEWSISPAEAEEMRKNLVFADISQMKVVPINTVDPLYKNTDEPERLMRTIGRSSKVRVKFGWHNIVDLDLCGKTIQEVKKSIADTVVIPDDAVCVIDSKRVGDQYILCGGETVEFIRCDQPYINGLISDLIGTGRVDLNLPHIDEKEATQNLTDPKHADLSVENLRGKRKASRIFCPNKLIRNGDLKSDEAFFMPTEGTYTIRILPAGPSGLYETDCLFVAQKQHYLDGWGNGNKNVVACTKKHTGHDGEKNTWDGECVLCDHWKHLWAMIDIANKKGEYKEAERYRKEAIRCKGMERFYYNVIVYDAQGNPSGPKIWSVSWVHDQIMQLANGDKNLGLEPWPITDLGEKGISLKVERRVRRFSSGMTGYPECHVRVCSKETAAGTASQIEFWMANLWDLKKVINGWQKTEEETVAAMETTKLSINLKRCATCKQRLKLDSAATFCTKECLNHQRRKENNNHCPICGETQVTRNPEGRLAFICGFSGSMGKIKDACKHSPTCRCFEESSQRECQRGCSCLAANDLVDQVEKRYKDNVVLAKSEIETMAIEDEEFLAELRKME